MSEESEKKKSKKILSAGKMSRRDVIQAVTEPDSVILQGELKQKTVTVAPARSIKADTMKLIRDMDVVPNSILDRVIRLFCEEKKTTAINTKVFVTRIRNLNDEQLKLVALLCRSQQFRATTILRAVQSVRRFDGARLLALRAFIDLDGVGPDPLNRFFASTLAQSDPDEVGMEVYRKEVEDKTLRPDQYNAFYNICHHIEGISPSDAIKILLNTKNIKYQHAKLINAFLRKGVMYGGKPISSDNVMNFVKLWLILPELRSGYRFEKMVKRIDKQTDKKQDFQFIVETYKTTILKERSSKKRFAFIRRFF